MKRVTALRSGRGRRVNVFLDGKLAFSLEAEAVSGAGLHKGQALTDEQVEALAGSDRVRRCFDAAVRFIDYRPRSEAEVRVRLKRRGLDDDGLEVVIARLKEQGLIDDVAFARFWKDNRDDFRPRSQWLLRQELKQKGVDTETIDQVIGGVDDADSAYRAAVAKARKMPRSEYESFRRRMGEYLRRRGFTYGVINKTVDKVWQEPA